MTPASSAHIRPMLSAKDKLLNEIRALSIAEHFLPWLERCVGACDDNPLNLEYWSKQARKIAEAADMTLGAWAAQLSEYVLALFPALREAAATYRASQDARVTNGRCTTNGALISYR